MIGSMQTEEIGVGICIQKMQTEEIYGCKFTVNLRKRIINHLNFILMKVMKLSIAALAYLFVDGFTPKPLATQTYYYISGTDYQRLEPGHTTESSLCERTMNCANFTDASNWTLTTQAFTPTSDLSKYIGSITFDEESVADGGSDGQLTLQEALNAVCTQYQAPNPDAMQHCYMVQNAQVCITTATSCH
jgi:hypothetical protein